MPIYEYECTACSHHFEVLVRNGAAVARCPTCQSESVERRLSVFAVGTTPRSSASASPQPCQSCGDPRGPGACSLN